VADTPQEPQIPWCPGCIALKALALMQGHEGEANLIAGHFAFALQLIGHNKWRVCELHAVERIEETPASRRYELVAGEALKTLGRTWQALRPLLELDLIKSSDGVTEVALNTFGALITAALIDATRQAVQRG